MLLDSLVLRAIALELDRELAGVRIEKIHQPAPNRVTLKLHPAPRGRHLAIELDRVFGHVALSDRDETNPAAPPPFCALLRKYLEAGRIRSVRQWGVERILELTIDATRDGERLESRLVCELFGNVPNLYLMRAGGPILGGCRPWRTIERLAPGQYLPPAARALPGILEADRAALVPALRAAMEKHSTRPLLSSFDALGAGLAAWLLELALTESEATAWTALEAVRAAVRAGSTTLLQLALPEAEPLLVPWQAAEPIPGKLGSAQLFASPSEAVEASLVGQGTRAAVVRLAGEVRLQLAREEKRIRHRLERVREDRERARDADRFERWGHLLQAHPHAAGAYDRSVRLRDLFEPEAPEVEIPLEPGRTLQASARAYFTRAARMRRAVPKTEAVERECLESLGLLERSSREAGRLADAPVQEAMPALAALAARIARGGEAGPRRLQRDAGFREFQSSDGRRILVGRSARENDRLSTREARKGDLWLHAHESAGAHVVVRLGGGECPQATLLEAAQLAAHFSPLRYSGKARVAYTRADQVRKPPGSAAGLVTLRSFETIVVTCDPSLPARLLARPPPES